MTSRSKRDLILEAILAAPHPVSTSELHIASKSNTITIVQNLRMEGAIRIAGWRRNEDEHGWRMLLGPGCAPDEPRPARLDKHELKARKDARRIARLMAPTSAPAALPLHTPTYGIFGI